MIVDDHLTFLRGLWEYVVANILTLSPPGFHTYSNLSSRHYSFSITGHDVVTTLLLSSHVCIVPPITQQNTSVCVSVSIYRNTPVRRLRWLSCFCWEVIMFLLSMCCHVIWVVLLAEHTQVLSWSNSLLELSINNIYNCKDRERRDNAVPCYIYAIREHYMVSFTNTWLTLFVNGLTIVTIRANTVSTSVRLGFQSKTPMCDINAYHTITSTKYTDHLCKPITMSCSLNYQCIYSIRWSCSLLTDTDIQRVF